ncbi:release factor glutamine methyltransferase [Brevibacillus agri]|uniref:Release factor glutamine methyltransferase n=2 Tax=Brevibacillus agri TaxID=51101 RepID=A0A3M8AY58_9BACL|nr:MULTISPECIES: peptide chain release factor N(5)-glutamine methyltransferase [Brevibacillus]EJL40362.1 protein-(glutamine-N5) methyltransferase, release factor-specific [Brevibacillus sp. CF112]MBG9567815.1 SAM-dependent methyltransferase [Brevibacillus agri]MBY0051270.1 peptide chain release factor N(5)-glutamine methyltransferase [Brevibacillus agri]MDN4091665.1 peptide chain release factor N(5)-glutamine methyltransferase [Brevibacillus agri]MED1641910.1 peptide chain release factor N(5)-
MHTQLDWSDVTTIREAQVRASSFLREKGAKDPLFEAELMIRHCLGWDRTRYLISMAEPIAAETLAKLDELCQRRSRHEPLQYMFGEQEFFGRAFTVRPGVLIPRPETEILVEQVLAAAAAIWPESEALAVADIGTGSGAICITLALEKPHWQVTTVDLSPDATAVARENAERLGASVRFLQGDLVQPLLAAGEKVDILVSNPPYIPSRDVDELDEEVRLHEPRLALDGGDDGLDCYRRLCEALPALLKDKAVVAFEVGIHQAQDVATLLQASGVIEQVQIVPDLAGIERVVIGVRR